MLAATLQLLAHVLVPMFLVGMAGSAVIVVVTLTSDLAHFLSDAGNEESTHETLN